MCVYLALYRKYRPRTFDDVISQEHITTTLKNQIMSGSAAHAYLFTGSRGTGKTTCAKIFAMAVNCLDPQDGNPCLECERCKEILDGSATDIVEMDAASNNGIDDVRKLRDEVVYTPVSCKYRVYIIDEVHELSVPAFNALLKTLEEPPPHVKFVLATTELHKIPATISSRCQRFEFRRVNIADSAERLLKVAELENVTLDRDAAELIARLSDGGMRDALSVLDRCIAADSHITSQTVRDCAGIADNRHLFEFSRMIAQKDTAGCLRLLSELHRDSKDIALIIDGLLGHFRDLMLCKTAPNERELLTALPDWHEALAEIAGVYSLEEILRCLTLLQQCADSIGKIKQRKTLAEMCFVKMCTGAEIASAAPRTAAQTVVFKELPPERAPAAPPKPPATPAEKAAADKMRALSEQVARLTQPVPGQASPGQAVPEQSSHQPPPEQITPSVPGEVGYEPPPTEQIPPSEPEMISPPVSGQAGYEPPPPEPPDFFEPPFPEPPPLDDWNEHGDQGDLPQQETAFVKPASPPPEKTEPKKKELPEISDIPDITQEQWQQAVAKMDIITAGMLKDSSVRTEGGVLVVCSANTMLLENVKGDELLRFEKTVSEALGSEVRIRLESAAAAPEEDTASPSDKLLSKARRLGIKVDDNE